MVFSLYPSRHIYDNRIVILRIESVKKALVVFECRIWTSCKTMRVLHFFSFKFVVIIGHLLWFLSSLNSFIPFVVFFMVFGKKKKGWWKGAVHTQILPEWHSFYRKLHWDSTELLVPSSAWLVWVWVWGAMGLGALNQIYRVRLPEQGNDLITRGISCVPVKKSGAHA